jgi:hypothetical protein
METGMSETTRELIQLRDEHLKQAIVHLAKQRNLRVSVLLRQMLEREVALETAYTAALTSESAHEAKARARRLRIVLAPFWEYLAQQGELPLAQARSYGDEASASAAPSVMPPPAEDAGESEYDLDEGISGFAGGISDD